MQQSPRPWRPMRTAPRKTNQYGYGPWILVATAWGDYETVRWTEADGTGKAGWQREGPVIEGEDPPSLLGWQYLDPPPKRKIL